jgi:hypothetical protein
MLFLSTIQKLLFLVFSQKFPFKRQNDGQICFRFDYCFHSVALPLKSGSHFSICLPGSESFNEKSGGIFTRNISHPFSSNFIHIEGEIRSIQILVKKFGVYKQLRNIGNFKIEMDYWLYNSF